MVGFCVMCHSQAELDNSGYCQSCVKLEKILRTVIRQFTLRGKQVHIFDLAQAVGVDPSLLHNWIEKNHVGGVHKPNGSLSKKQGNNTLASSHTSPRRVMAKWERYWRDVSRVRRNAHRRIWLSGRDKE